MALLKYVAGPFVNKRFCVVNTHIFWDPLFADVKLLQTLALTFQVCVCVSVRAARERSPAAARPRSALPAS